MLGGKVVLINFAGKFWKMELVQHNQWHAHCEALGVVPFNIKTHFIDIDLSSLVKVETRERPVLQYPMKRLTKSISHYHEIPGSPPVLALREEAILLVIGDRAELVGKFLQRVCFKNAFWFLKSLKLIVKQYLDVLSVLVLALAWMEWVGCTYYY